MRSSPQPARALLLGLLALGAFARAAEPERAPLSVYFADGTRQPLRGWSLSYEYAAWKKSEGPERGANARRELQDLLVGGRTVATAGLVVEVQYVGGAARSLVLVSGSRRNLVKSEAPAPGLLAPDLGKDMVIQARGLDLRGETLAGGRREYCLLSYTVLAECAAPEPGQRVVKLEFPP